MKKKILTVLGITVFLRLVNILLFNNDPLFYLSPRNFNGRGLLITPGLIDFLIPLLIIFVFRDKRKKSGFNIANIPKPLLVSLSIFLAPVVTGLLLYSYVQKSYIAFEFNLSFLLKYLLFVLSFAAINLFADKVKFQKRILNGFVLFLGIAAIAYSQDIFGSANPMYILMALINSTGLTVVLFAVGLRKYYKEFPLETIAATAITGIFSVFFVFSALSVSFFTIFLPFISMVSVAFCWYKSWKLKTKLILGSLPFLLSLFLSYGLPPLLPPELANEIVERKNEESFKTEKYKNITVKYKDDDLKDIALKFAKVIDRANAVSRNQLGVSPEVRELVVTGIGPGGFHAEYPNRIVGRIISKKYMQNCDDSSFLNSPRLLPGFPDPVNAILHEYSHLFGTIPYHKWYPGAEEEGWATYSATRLSKLLYKDNKDLWSPAYNFEAQADKITELNLSGKAVAWSHPNEFGGFILWYRLGKQLGLPVLYRKRRSVSKHDLKNGSLYYVSNPAYAAKAVQIFGKENFLKYGKFAPKKFGDIYDKTTYLYLAKTTGIDTNRISKMYDLMKEEKINPSVPLPE